MEKIGKCKVKYFGKWMKADIVKGEFLKEPMYLIEDDSTPVALDVLDEEPIEVEDHRPDKPPGGN